MALSALQASQLATLLAGHAKQFTANNPGQNEFADYLLRSGQSATMGLIAEEEEKKKKKKEKGLLGGKIGSALGTAAGIALAPVTGGASLAAAGAIGGGLGGLGGQLLAGGSPSMGSFALDAAQGGLSGYTYGKQGELAQSVQTSGVTPDIPASPTIDQKMGQGIANAMPDASTLSTPTFPGAMTKLPLPRPGVAGIANPTSAFPRTPARQGFMGRIGPALSHVMGGGQQQPTANRYFVMPDGTQVPY